MNDEQFKNTRLFFLELTDCWRDYIPDEKVRKITEELAMKLIDEIKKLKNENKELDIELLQLRRENERLHNELARSNFQQN